MSRGEGLPIPVDWPNSRPTSTGTWLGPERRARARHEAEIEASTPEFDPEFDAPASDPGTTASPSNGRPTDAAELPVAATGQDRSEVDVVIELADGETTMFEAAIDAYNAGNFERAESLFLEEASRTLEVAPQRAAIAYRQAALAADHAGNPDGADHWMRLAGREYLRVTEDVRTPLPFIREAALMAAKCFLKVKNENVASKGLRRAQAIDSVLRADDDLTAPSTGIPFRHESAPDDGSLSESEDSSSSSRLQRLRQRLAGRPAA
jgi:hypothetical protein